MGSNPHGLAHMKERGLGPYIESTLFSHCLYCLFFGIRSFSGLFEPDNILLVIFKKYLCLFTF
jgi:hypothetical protein